MPENESETISLRDRIKRHQRRKSWLTTPLLTLGMLGLVLPLPPAIIFLELGLRIDSPFGRSSLGRILRRGKKKEPEK